MLFSGMPRKCGIAIHCYRIKWFTHKLFLDNNPLDFWLVFSSYLALDFEYGLNCISLISNEISSLKKCPVVSFDLLVNLTRTDCIHIQFQRVVYSSISHNSFWSFFVACSESRVIGCHCCPLHFIMIDYKLITSPKNPLNDKSSQKLNKIAEIDWLKLLISLVVVVQFNTKLFTIIFNHVGFLRITNQISSRSTCVCVHTHNKQINKNEAKIDSNTLWKLHVLNKWNYK